MSVSSLGSLKVCGWNPTSREQMRQLLTVRNGADLERFLTPYTATGEARAFAQTDALSGSAKPGFGPQCDFKRAIACGVDRLEVFGASLNRWI